MTDPGPGTVPAVSQRAEVSLIICSRERRLLLRETIASILAGNEVPGEMIVIDQSARPDPELDGLAAAHGVNLRYVWSSSVGLSSALNLGISLATQDHLVFTHDDVFVDRDWLATMADRLDAAGPRTVVTGRVLPSASEHPGAFVPTLNESELPAVYRGRIDSDVLFPLNMALHRGSALTVGPFDEELGPGTRYPAGEDNDYAFRLLEAGYEIHYLPEAVVYHRAWRDDYVRLRWSYGRGQGAFYAKHLRGTDGHIRRRFYREIRSELSHALHVFRFNPLRSSADLLYVAAMLLAAAQWIVTRPGRSTAPEKVRSRAIPGAGR